MEALRRFDIPAGDYLVPCPTGPSAMKDPAFLEKRNKGPLLIMTVMPGSPIAMGPQFVQWFVYSMVVGLFAGYVASRALPPGAPYLDVFRFVGTVAFVGYSRALWQYAIWYKRSSATTLRSTIRHLRLALAESVGRTTLRRRSARPGCDAARHRSAAPRPATPAG
jgi:hypothetical protein